MKQGLSITKLALIALLTTVAALFAASTASAAITHAPVVTQEPSGAVNTTHAAVTFEFEKNPAEGSTANPIRFFCRQYPTATPPAPEAGWGFCGDNAGSSSWATANGSQTFEVAARETLEIATQGPIATVVWTQNITAPTKAPVITSQPDDPTDLLESSFTFEGGAGEENLSNRAEYRLDGGPWINCAGAFGGCLFGPGNGEHTVEFRAGNVHGFGPPSAPITWTINVPDPASSVPVTDVAATTWDGSVADRPFDPLMNIGDINDDGRDDLSMPSEDIGDSSNDGVIDIVFGSAQAQGNRTLGTQSAAEGFRILGESFNGAGIQNAAYAAGDQNGDGIDDMIVQVGQIFGLLPNKYAVIYGGLSVEDLPACPTGPARCLNTADLTPDQGYTITSDVNFGIEDRPRGVSTADFDGDGVEDFLFATGSGFGDWYIMKGEERSGTVHAQDLPDSEFTTLKRSLTSGSGAFGLGDLDGDGKDDAAFTDGSSGVSTVLYGRAFGDGEINLNNVTDPNDGFTIYGPAQNSAQVTPVGDADGDGRPNIAVTLSGGVGGADSKTLTIFNVPERGSDEFLVIGPDMDPATGYIFEPGPNNTELGADPARGIGDFDNDKLTDVIVGAPATPVGGAGSAGAAYVLLGQNPRPSAPIGLGAALTPEAGVGLTGLPSSNLGNSVASLGDLDSDGIPDFAVNAPRTNPNGVDAAGSVYIIYGKSLINQVKTGNANGIDGDSAVLNAGVSTNDRDTEVRFEYGKTDAYGSSTTAESFEGSSAGDAASAEITGLAKNTTYHYRAVATNELGLTRYGDDRTFTTTNTSGGGGSNCDTDNTLPGCSAYDHCKVKPADCQGSNNRAKLATLIATPKSLKVKRGKRGSVSVIVVNAGGQSANGVKVCVKAPKKLVKVKKCQSVGGLPSGATKTKTFKVTVKKSAKKGKKASLRFTASAAGLDSRKASASVKVK